MSKFVVKGKINTEKLQAALLAKLAHLLNGELFGLPDFLRTLIDRGTIKIKLDVSVTASKKDIAGYNEVVVPEQNIGPTVLQFLAFCDDVSVDEQPISPAPAVKTYSLKTVEESKEELLRIPVSSLNLSIRARKCMIRLGINTIEDLIKKTSDQLLECKNFGVTCLNEVKEKLKDLGLFLNLSEN